MALATLLTAVLVFVVLGVCLRLITNPTIKQVATVLLIVIVLIWIIRHMAGLLHCCSV